jgi:hypothetical protein
MKPEKPYKTNLALRPMITGSLSQQRSPHVDENRNHQR